MDYNSDILWIETCIPAIATIYYNLHLQKTHTLYCPDDITTSKNTEPVKQRHVRDLARDILHIVDSNNYKKLALHFINPLGSTKTDDLVRFLLKRRSRLTLSHLTLPCSPIQQYYLSGWSFSLNEVDLDPLWRRQCRVKPKHETEDPSTLIPATNTYTEMEFNQPFVLASQKFKKKALFVHVTQEMLLLQPEKTSTLDTEDNAFQLNETTLMAIQGWMDAVSTVASENGNTLILIADEKSLFTGSDIIKLQGLNPEEMDRTLGTWRTRLWEKLESMVTNLPIYFLLNRFTVSATQATLTDHLAWLQHRHHICVPHSLLLTWRPCFKTGDHAVFTQLEKVVLTSVAKYDRLKWKTEFVELLQKMDAITFTDPLIYISPEKLINDPPLSTADHYSTPMVIQNQLPFLPTVYESGPSFTHSVSSSSIHVTDSWILKVQQRQKTVIKEDTIEKYRSNHDTNDVKDVNEQGDNKANDMEDDRSLELENLADSLDHDLIRDYISNSGAFTRGEGLLHIWTLTEHSWEDENCLVVLFGKAKGTSDKPYQVYVKLNRGDQDKVIKNGFCSCPVGQAGRCKHVTALLLRFMINVDDFEPANEAIVMPLVNNDQAKKAPTDHAPVKPLPSTKALESALSLPAQESLANTTPSSLTVPSTETNNVKPDDKTTNNCNINIITPPSSTDADFIEKGDSLPQRRRVLPWDTDSPKAAPKSKRQRVNKPPESVASSRHLQESHPIDPPLSPEETPRSKPPAKPKKPVTRKPRAKTQAKKETVHTDGYSDSDPMSWDDGKQHPDTPKPVHRSTRQQEQDRPRTAPPLDCTDEPIKLYYKDDDSAITPPRKSTSLAFDFNMTSDDADSDDEELTRGSYTPTSCPSTRLPIQKSNLSLPMTNLALLGVSPGSETDDESSQPPLPSLERSATSDLFDELGL